MKDFLKILSVVVVCLFAGAYLHKCQSPLSEGSGRRDGCVKDTMTVYDTITYKEPGPVLSAVTGYKEITIPITNLQQKQDTLPRIRADTDTTLYAIENIRVDEDSMTLRLPIVQNVYEAEEYKAYVSGVYPRLDSIFVFPKREVVTIKKPPKRWHIGPAIGYGYTPQGFQPYIGVSVVYSIFSF